jgi:hypothetical protein
VPDTQDYDWWAIRVVVREGKPMHNLTRAEKVVAAKLMRRKGIDGLTVSFRLGIKEALVHKFWKLPDPIDMDGIDPSVMGAVIPKPLVSRKDALLMTGS